MTEREMKLSEIEQNVLRWAADRALCSSEAPTDRTWPDWGAAAKQMLKLSEEVGEIAGATAKQNRAAAYDGIGDAMVVLTILARQLGTDLGTCYALAWDEIKGRTGRTVGGVFVKDDPS